MEAEANTEGQEQIPPVQAVVRRVKRRSIAWKDFTEVGENHGKKAKCKRCQKELVAGHGTSTLLKHAKICKGTGGSIATDEHESDQLIGVSTSVNAIIPSWDSLPSSLSYDYDLQTTLLLSDLTPSPACNPPPPLRCDPPPEVAQPCTDPPPSVTQNLPYNPPLPFPLAASHPVPVPDDELPDHHDHGPEDEEARKHLARMIALQGYDPALVEDDCFRRFVGSLNPKFKFPSRLAVEEMCDDIFDESRKGLLSWLSCSDRMVSLALGTAQTIHGEVLYTACHFIDDEWNLHQVVLNAYQTVYVPILYGPLLGVSEVAFNSEFYDMAVKTILRDLLEHDLADKVFAMIWSIKDRGEIRRPIERLFSGNFTTCMDFALHGIAEAIGLDPEFTENIYKKVDGLDFTRESRQKLFSDLGLDHLRIYGRYWYSSYCSLMFLRKHGSCTIADKDYSQLVELLCKIWGVIYRAIQRISTFRHPTSNQCLVELFKVREVLQSELERTDGDSSIVCRGHRVFRNENDDVADVLRKAKDTLDSTLQDIYLVWSVPLVLDPRYKLTYIKFIFSRAFGSRGARYISEVTRKIKKLYADYVEYGDAGINGAGSDGVTDETAAGSSTDPLGQAWDEHCLSGDGMMDDIASHQDAEELLRSLKDLVIGAAVDPLGQAWDEHCRSLDGRTDAGSGSYLDAEKELDRYLNDPRVEATQDFDILNWWKVNSLRYPTVARMARDDLAMPTCSKLSSEQMAQVSSIVRGYSKKKYRQAKYES